MNPPVEQKAYADLKQAIQALAGTSPAAFKVFIGWLGSELQRRDEENRVIKTANLTTEAEALSVIIKHVAACLAPATDRNSTNASAEGVSAISPM